MSFKKFAKVPVITLAEAEFTDAGLDFTKSASKNASFYQSKANKLDVKALLKLVAKDYDISEDPHDYLYEAVRAVTAEVPNENGDAFPKEELLRFDHKLGKAIYQTFIGKPHHINHRADDPKTSRGVVLDASYNDTSPADEVCKTCNNRTAEAEGCDSTGIHCKKCGSVVKDEFVELLLAVDTKKDPTFADGVRTGSLNSLSMGCEAMYTDCSICDNRARSVNQFCKHIRAGNKKKIFKTASGDRLSFEKCGGVTFTEISRVDQPADPTALQREIFDFQSMPMATESEMLIMSSRLAKLESMVKSAQHAPVDLAAVIAIITKQIAELEAEQNLRPYDPSNEMQKHLEALRATKSNLEQVYRERTPEQPKEEPVAEVEAVELHPQAPFTNVAESIRWAENSVSRLKGEIARLTAEREASFKAASESGKPMYAWAKASYDAQIRAASQYISRLEDYAAKAREIEASGQPWNKGLVRSMSRFFASKEAQTNEMDKIREELEPLKTMHPEIYNDLNNMLHLDDNVSEPQSIDDYIKERKEDRAIPRTPGELGIETDKMTVGASKDKMISDLDAILDTVKENTVGFENTLKFAESYKNLEASVTKSGNVKIFTPDGTLFVVRPETKVTTKAAAKAISEEILKCVAENGMVDTLTKYKVVVGPKMAQVLEHAVVDFKDGREEGDKKPMPEGGEQDMEARAKPEDSLVGEEHTDRKDMVREQRDQSNSDVLEGVEVDMAEGRAKENDSVTDEEHSDKAEPRGKPEKTTLSEVNVDHKDLKPKTAQMDGAPAQPMPPTMAAPEAGPGCSVEACSLFNGKQAGSECECEAGCECKECGCKCLMGKEAAPVEVAEVQPVAVVAEKTASRIERLYKSRLTKLSEESTQKLAAVEKEAVKKVSDKMLRAIKLAAKRQALNLEYSPLKATMCDVLVNEMDLDSDSYFPGMDSHTAAKIIEATSTAGFDSFVESLVSRAAEFMGMNEEAFNAIEADAKNLRPAPVTVTAVSKREASREAAREEAISGNFVVAPSTTTDNISKTGNRETIRAALDTTKVRRTSQNLLKK